MPRTPDTSKHRLLTIGGPLLMLLCLGFIIVNTINYRSLHNGAFEQQYATYEAGTVRAAREMAQMFQNVEEKAEALATAIADGSLAKQDYEQALRDMLQKDGMFFGGAIAFSPYQFAPDRRLYAPYYSKQNGALSFMYIEQSYDYTLDNQEWYVQAIKSGSRWSSPYFDEAVGDILMTTYSAVVYQTSDAGTRQPIAVVTIDISIETMGDVIKAFGLGGTGYAEIIDENGLYLYSPTQSRVLNHESVFESTEWQQDSGFEVLRNLIDNQNTGITKLYDTMSDEFHWVSVAPILSTPWHVLGNFAEAETDPRTPELRHIIMYILLATVVLLCIALLYFPIRPSPEARVSWPTSLLLSLLLAIGTGQIWRVAMNYSSEKDRSIFPVSSHQAVAREARDYNLRAGEHLNEPPRAIPTGIYIESMKFLDSSDIRVVGRVWQKYNLERHQGIERGVIFPGAARLQIGDPAVTPLGEYDLVRWEFFGEWRFNQQFTRFPLMKDVFNIAIFPRDTADNILLLPDTESYSYLAPSDLPALSPDVFLLGWHFENSFFELRPWLHHTTFGMDPSLKMEPLPELHFSIEMEKAFIHSVISNLTPLAIAMIIAFITLLISTRDKARQEALRTGVGFDIGICTSIFFVVVLSHIGLRQRIVSAELFYLEYFYLLMYTNLIWVCCHSILSSLDHPLLEKLTFGLTAKKVYFPINFLIIFVFTWLIFFW